MSLVSSLVPCKLLKTFPCGRLKLKWACPDIMVQFQVNSLSLLSSLSRRRLAFPETSQIISDKWWVPAAAFCQIWLEFASSGVLCLSLRTPPSLQGAAPHCKAYFPVTSCGPSPHFSLSLSLSPSLSLSLDSLAQARQSTTRPDDRTWDAAKSRMRRKSWGHLVFGWTPSMNIAQPQSDGAGAGQVRRVRGTRRLKSHLSSASPVSASHIQNRSCLPGRNTC